MQFVETQKLGNIGFRVLYIFGSVMPFFILGNEVNKASTTVAYNEAITTLFIVAAILIVVYFLIFTTSAQTRIDSVGIHYKYWPLIPKWRQITWKEIKTVEVKKYDPISDFGGWGYKFGRKKNGIILGGDQALFIEKVVGKTFAISTLKAVAAKSAIDYWQPKNEEFDG